VKLSTAGAGLSIPERRQIGLTELRLRDHRVKPSTDSIAALQKTDAHGNALGDGRYYSVIDARPLDRPKVFASIKFTVIYRSASGSELVTTGTVVPGVRARVAPGCNLG
jgi:hypothetical protein